MYLTNEEEHALNGEYGEVLETAYRILVAIGNATNAEKLIQISWAHISGVNYNTIGDAGLLFLQEMSKGKVQVKSTINPIGFDPKKPSNVNEEFRSKQMQIIEAYRKINADLTFSCIPYEIIDIPNSKYVSLAESNAAVYANSILDLRTNKESALSALASAFTGKAPYSLLRDDKFREPDTEIKVNYNLEDELDYGLLGYFAGKVAKHSVSLQNIQLDEIWKSKALSAGLGTSGSCGIFTSKKGGEVIEFGKEEKESLLQELSDNNDGNIIIFGSPQLGLKDLYRLANTVKNKRFKKRCIAFCARKAYNDAIRIGVDGILEKAGVELYADCCACLTPLVNSNDSVITNSIKGAYYLKTWNKAKVSLKSLNEIVKSETI
jgi:hypothetical protein